MPRAPSKQLQNSPFKDVEFNMMQLSELLGISRTSLYQMEKAKVIEGRTVRSGASSKKVFGWSDLQRIVKHQPDKVTRPRDLKVKVFANLKGGVGKSSLASQVAMRASASGTRTLLIDLDPQAHASLALGFDNLSEEIPTILNCMFAQSNGKKASIDDVIQMVTPFLGIIPSSLAMSSLEVKLQQDYKGAEKLKKVLEQIRDDWDLIVIDTNPSASLLNINALLAADELCVVCATDFLSVSGLRQLFQILKDLQEDFDDFGPEIRVIPNLFDVREAIAQEALGVLRQQYGKFCCNTVVRKNVDLKEAQKLAQAVWLYKKRSPAAEDIAALTHELIVEEMRK